MFKSIEEGGAVGLIYLGIGAVPAEIPTYPGFCSLRRGLVGIYKKSTKKNPLFSKNEGYFYVLFLHMPM